MGDSSSNGFVDIQKGLPPKGQFLCSICLLDIRERVPSRGFSQVEPTFMEQKAASFANTDVLDD